MSDSYMIEITQQQLIFISVEADSPAQAIELALNQGDEISQPYPPEIQQIKARIIRGEYVE